ncbi:sugar kinase [Candidatus Berkelbacteria bacterium RBG_13_40_8]|uniref:Sugar kinase n=1 Tax=Candidatus Berkelbacteria bacterium RBG_13_40_8 TaxID=1797467 RepID=A0A1F5DNM1_9BACT|nr:MAG: sugar kinase [Candidatus Berkelbacteria bacterium RBG_13_40_8]
MAKLVITGTIGLDDIETPFGKVTSALGGTGAYAAIAASFFTKPSLVSIVGEDLPGAHLDLLKERGIDVAGVSRAGKTFRWKGFYEFDMNEAKTLKTELNALNEFNPKLPHDYKNAQFLFLANTDPKVQLKTLKQMKSRPFTLIDSMNFWIQNNKAGLLKVIKKSHMVVLNEGEARQLFDDPNLIKAGRKLIDLGPEFAVIKKGEHGALLFSAQGFFSAPGYPLEELKDPTGCGDSFSGAMIGYIAKTGDLSERNIRKAVIYGSIVASYCAESFSLEYIKETKLKDIKERYGIFRKIRQF